MTPEERKRIGAEGGGGAVGERAMMGNSGVTRREAMKRALKAGAYAAPAILSATVVPAGVAAQVSGPAFTFRIVPSLIANPTPSDSSHLIGTGFTPNADVIGWAFAIKDAATGANAVFYPDDTLRTDGAGNFDSVFFWLPPRTAGIRVCAQRHPADRDGCSDRAQSDGDDHLHLMARSLYHCAPLCLPRQNPPRPFSN